jgi:hypothetical protein
MYLASSAARMREVSYRTRPLGAVITKADAMVIGENGQDALARHVCLLLMNGGSEAPCRRS